MYRWMIEKEYNDGSTRTFKEEFKTYNECLEDLLKHRNIDYAFRSAFEKEVLELHIYVEKVED